MWGVQHRGTDGLKRPEGEATRSIMLARFPRCSCVDTMLFWLSRVKHSTVRKLSLALPHLQRGPQSVELTYVLFIAGAQPAVVSRANLCLGQTPACDMHWLFSPGVVKSGGLLSGMFI